MNADKLARALDELPAAYDLLPLFMLPGSRPDMGSHQRHGSDNTRSPLALSALDLADERTKADASPTRSDYELDRMAGARRQGVLPTLSSWVRLVDGELWDELTEHAEPDENPTVAGECAWLHSHIRWIGERQWLDEITQDIIGMLRDVREVTGEQQIHIKLYCLNTSCGWGVEEQSDGAWYRCTGCGRAWSRLELHRMAERKKPKTLAECALLAGVTERTLKTYKARGLLRVVGRGQGKTELYDPDDVMRVTMNLRYRQALA